MIKMCDLPRYADADMEEIAGLDIGHSEIIDHHCFSTARQLNSVKIHG